MNKLKNNVRLMGRVGQNPEIKELAGGRKLAKFSIAINESYKNDAGERITDTQWHNITAWGKQAELVAKLLKKGSELVLEGRLINNSYTDKDGIKRQTTEIVLQEFTLVGKKAADS